MSINLNDTNALSQCEQMLKNLLVPDDSIRKSAEIQLQQGLQNNQSKEVLCLYCSQILLNSTDISVKLYCAIIIRKIFLVNDDSKNDIIKTFNFDNKNVLKNNLFNALVNNVQDKNLNKKIANAIVNVFTCLLENDEKWDELLKYIIGNFNLELSENNLNIIELSLYLLSNVYGVANDQLKEGIPIFLNCFSIYFKSNILSLKAKTVECINELLCSTSSKKESKKFREFIYYILETTLQCLKEHSSENLKICLDSLNDLSECEPKILRKSFSDIFILMGKIIEDKEIDDNLREIAYELLINLIENMPKLMKNDEEKLSNLIQSLFKYAMEIDEEIDDEWLTPKATTFINDEFIPEQKLDEATSLLLRLFDALDEKVVLKIVSNNIAELIQHSSEKDWKYKYIAYITIAEVISYVKELNHIENIIEMILKDVNNQNVKIQYAALYCIAELADEHNPDFQNEYHGKVIGSLLNVLNNSNVLRIRLQVVDALDCFIEHVTDEVGAKYLQNSFDILFTVFNEDDTKCPCSLKEGILDVVQEFIDASNEEFKKYAEKCFSILLEYLKKILNDGTNKTLIGILLETISIIGPLCPEVYKNYLLTLVNTLIKIQASLSSFKENIGNYLLSSWEKIVPNLLIDNKEKLLEVTQSLIELLKKPPEMSVSNNPNYQVNVQEFFKEDEEKKEEKGKPNLQTSETEEFATFIEILNLILESAPATINASQVENLYPVILSLLKYPNTDIQGEVANTFSNSIKSLIATNCEQNALHNAAKKYIADIVEQLFKESNFSLIVSLLDSIREIISSVKLFLTTPEINDLSEKLLKIFDKVEQNRIDLNKQKLKTQNEIENDKKTGDNKIFSDDEEDLDSEQEAIDEIQDEIEELEEVQTSFSEFFGTLFDTHKNLTLEIVEKFLKDYLPKYFNEQSSTFEKKLGVLIIDDMAEFLQQDLIGNIWNDILKTMITYSNHKDYELRNAAAYGLGIFAKFTKTDFKMYENDLLNSILNSMTFPDDIPKAEIEDMKFARDNAVSALGKTIKYHGQELNDLNKYLDIWVNKLPITKDHTEGKLNNKFLMEILQKDPKMVLGENNKNLSHIIVVLSKAYNSDDSDDETNKLIEQFANGILNNNEFKSVLDKVVNEHKKGKTLNKIKGLFKLK
jgi:hypothetical protein